MNTVKVLLLLVANFGLSLEQFDKKKKKKKNASLHEALEEEIYVEIPLGFDKGLGRAKMCKLKKVLYGLK